MSYTLELHVYPITMPSKPKLPEESAAQVDVRVDATKIMPRDAAAALEQPGARDATPGKLISRMCTTLCNISGTLC